MARDFKYDFESYCVDLMINVDQMHTVTYAEGRLEVIHSSPIVFKNINAFVNVYLLLLFIIY